MSLTDTVRILTEQVVANPTDTTNRKILADALQEAGHDDTAAFVRTFPVSVEDGEFVTYALEMRCEGDGDEDVEYATRPTEEECDEETADWTRGGEWGSDGASVDYWWHLARLTASKWAAEEEAEEVAGGRGTVEIEPDHATLIAATVGRWDRDRLCGTDPDDHDWTSEGEGGCDENPGVWSTGGTSMTFASHCRTCGLHRTEYHCGSQRNPGERDTVEYTMPNRWCAECQSEDCGCEQSDE
jgi:uncharacterized protein (TIGR02996 family)